MASAVNLTDQLEAGLRAASLRSKVIANNIANIDTPGYKRQAVQFEKLLAEAMTDGSEVDVREITPEVFEPRTTETDSTGNDVNIDEEIGEMVKNSTRYKTYMRVLIKTYQQMEQAMRTEM